VNHRLPLSTSTRVSPTDAFWKHDGKGRVWNQASKAVHGNASTEHEEVFLEMAVLQNSPLTASNRVVYEFHIKHY